MRSPSLATSSLASITCYGSSQITISQSIKTHFIMFNFFNCRRCDRNENGGSRPSRQTFRQSAREIQTGLELVIDWSMIIEHFVHMNIRTSKSFITSCLRRHVQNLWTSRLLSSFSFSFLLICCYCFSPLEKFTFISSFFSVFVEVWTEWFP